MKSLKIIPSLIFLLTLISLVLLLSLSDITAKPTNDPWGCEVHIYKNLSRINNLKEIGTVNLMDPLRTRDKTKFLAIRLFKYMSCAMSANVINITEEQDSSKPYGCYLAKATFYLDTLNYVIGKEIEYEIPLEVKYKSPFAFYFHYAGLEYLSLNDNFWNEVLPDNEFPTVGSAGYTFYSFGYSIFYHEFYFNFSYASTFGSKNSNDVYIMSANSNKLGLEAGYCLYIYGIRVTPFLCFWGLYEKCVISNVNEEIPLSTQINSPEIIIDAKQNSLALGLDIIIPVFGTNCAELKFGYNVLNITDYPRLSTEYNKISYPGVEFIKKYYLGVSYTVEIPAPK